jgi:hypothetical protein
LAGQAGGEGTGLAGTSAGDHLVGLGHGQDIADLAAFQVAAQTGVGAVDLIPGYPACQRPGVQRPGDHYLGQLQFGRERCPCRDARRGAPARVADP